jgi:hypothetical protein
MEHALERRLAAARALVLAGYSWARSREARLDQDDGSLTIMCADTADRSQGTALSGAGHGWLESAHVVALLAISARGGRPG